MIRIACVNKLNIKNHDEVWAITRSDKRIPKGVKHVPELSPSWKLFNLYRRLKNDGKWGSEAFEAMYVPKFLEEMKSRSAQEKLRELVEKDREGKAICLYCYCTDESLCHRILIAAILMAMGVEVYGVMASTARYEAMWKESFGKDPGRDMAVAFTGPRPKSLCGYDRNAYRPFVESLADIMQGLYRQGYRKFITGGAQGFDQLAFWAAYRLKREHGDVGVYVYAPFPGQDSVWPKEGCFAQGDYRKMLAAADGVEYVMDHEPINSSSAIHALFERNEMMVDDAGLVIALCNNDSWYTEQHGGTEKCMQYAHNKKRPMRRLKYGTSPCLSIVGQEDIN